VGLASLGCQCAQTKTFPKICHIGTERDTVNEHKMNSIYICSIDLIQYFFILSLSALKLEMFETYESNTFVPDSTRGTVTACRCAQGIGRVWHRASWDVDAEASSLWVASLARRCGGPLQVVGGGWRVGGVSRMWGGGSQRCENTWRSLRCDRVSSDGVDR